MLLSELFCTQDFTIFPLPKEGHVVAALVPWTQNCLSGTRIFLSQPWILLKKIDQGKPGKWECQMAVLRPTHGVAAKQKHGFQQEKLLNWSTKLF